jgi:alpha-tubulin suppressor-like RCC1 family protein
MHASRSGFRPMKTWAGMLGGCLLVACGAPETLEPGGGESGADAPGAAQAPLTQTISATYDPALKTVRCEGQTWNCDASRTLDGRGQLGEYNAPNTLGGTCLDGNEVSATGDEWVRKVRIFTLDQTPLTQGRPASIEVTVSLPQLSQGNVLDLYSTPSVTSPAWTWITSLTPASTGGQSVLKATFTLPVGSGRQAIRAALRRGGTASPCTQGGSDDRDDLVFTAAPAYVSGSKALSVAAGLSHSLAVRADGTLWGWGANANHELGTGVDRYQVTKAPAQATLLSNVKSVHATSDSSLVLRKDGTVWGWGGNSAGVLGNGTTTASATPVQVVGLTDVTALATGPRHVLALKSNGTVWAWGDSSSVSLGTSATTLPVRAGSLTQVTAIAAGRGHSVVLKSDGTVWTWGDGTAGNLGNGPSNQGSTVPIRVTGLTGVSSIAAGHEYSLAIRANRQLWAWGMGPLGNAPVSQYAYPTQTYLWPSGNFRVFAGKRHAVAVETTQGTPWTWGDLGTGSDCEASAVNFGALPAPVMGLTGVSEASIGEFYAHALLTDGTVWGWGDSMFQTGTELPGWLICNPLQVALP